MKPEQFDRTITIERYTTTQDEGSGEEVQAWATFATVQASKRDVSDGERLSAAQVQAHITTRFVIRWSSNVADVNAKDRLICEGVTYAIVGTKEQGRREGIEITAAREND